MLHDDDTGQAEGRDMLHRVSDQTGLQDLKPDVSGLKQFLEPCKKRRVEEFEE